MRLIGNILWCLFGGLEAAIGYMIGAIVLCCTLVGIPFGLQLFKIGLLCLWPFGAEVNNTSDESGCLYMLLNILWFVFGGIYVLFVHFCFGVLLCLTIVGIPFGKQHFKLSGLALHPFGRNIQI
ncbi:MAG: YccF domain-containing protein [Paludibacter sp.]|nr:YccF domain-containing protein [Bacteroidales bacterium]MCM1069474.1 YccF domain-containing protein [Prevotella sp.]MCM1354130.1 YccF domain-containing protein [Bacteroides sp.]MCM1443013.1 YccF domain-containing protein [Muribaculum sp.]MCM1482205.1 YccF domain-containing protein [Paludibacter sp.]